MAGIKVWELVALLERHADPEAEVRVEGCDCYGDCEGIDVERDSVMIARSLPEFSPEGHIAQARAAIKSLDPDDVLRAIAERKGIDFDKLKELMP